MMDFNTFMTVVKDNAVSYMGEGYEDITVDVRPINKTNKQVHSLNFAIPGINLMPSLEMENLYDQYKNKFDGDFQTFIEYFSDFARDAVKSARINVVNANKLDLSDTSDIIPVLINTESNKELIKTAPHREIEDMSIVYKKILTFDSEFGAVLVTNDIMENSLSGITEDDLFMEAVENQERMFPVEFKSMSDKIRGMMIADGIPEDMVESMIPDTPGMYFLSNTRNYYGASLMVDPVKMLEYKEEIGGDYYIIPSSVHEVLLVDKNQCNDVQFLVDMVSSVNPTVSEKDRLSNNIYEISDSGRIVKASNVPTKGIKDIDLQKDNVSMTI